jgi:uncharacterized protein involved in outer membrane biogenesis
MTPSRILLATTALVLAGAFIGPALVGAERFRPAVEAAASKALGRAVIVTGPLSARLLPSPALTLDGIASTDQTVSARMVRLSFQALPLLAGQARLSGVSVAGGRLGTLDGIEGTASLGGTTITAQAKGKLGDMALALDFQGHPQGGGAKGRLGITVGALAGSGELSVQEGDIALEYISATYGNGTIKGAASASLSAQPILVEGTFHADEIDLGTTLAAPSPATLVDTDSAAITPQSATAAAPSLAVSTLPKAVTINLDLAADRLKLAGLTLGQVQAHALLDGGRLNIDRARGLFEPAGQFTLSLGLEMPEGKPRLDGTLRANTAQAGLDARITTQGDTVVAQPLTLLLGNVVAKGQAKLESWRPLSARLLFPQVAGLGLAGNRLLSLEAVVTPASHGLAFDQVRARAGELSATGKGVLTASPKLRLDADLAMPNLALAALLPPPAKGSKPMDARLEDLTAHLGWSDTETVIEHLEAKALGGHLSGAGRLTATGMAGALALRGAEVSRLGLAAGPVKLSKGRADLDATFQAQGHGGAQSLATLSGDARLAAKDGVVDGFDLAAINSRLARPGAAGGLVGLAQASLAGGQSRFSSLTATVRADKGILSSRDIELKADGGSLTGTLRLDLPRETIDSRLTLQLAAAALAPAVLRLDGPLDKPRATLDINALQRGMAAAR